MMISWVKVQTVHKRSALSSHHKPTRELGWGSWHENGSFEGYLVTQLVEGGQHHPLMDPKSSRRGQNDVGGGGREGKTSEASQSRMSKGTAQDRSTRESCAPSWG